MYVSIIRIKWPSHTVKLQTTGCIFAPQRLACIHCKMKMSATSEDTVRSTPFSPHDQAVNPWMDRLLDQNLTNCAMKVLAHENWEVRNSLFPPWWGFHVWSHSLPCNVDWDSIHRNLMWQSVSLRIAGIIVEIEKEQWRWVWKILMFCRCLVDYVINTSTHQRVNIMW